MSKSYWAYGVKNDKAVLVRCLTPECALHERELLKFSDCKTVGSVSMVKASEEEVRSALEGRGWTVEVVRDKNLWSFCNV